VARTGLGNYSVDKLPPGKNILGKLPLEKTPLGNIFIVDNFFHVVIKAEMHKSLNRETKIKNNKL